MVLRYYKLYGIVLLQLYDAVLLQLYGVVLLQLYDENIRIKYLIFSFLTK